MTGMQCNFKATIISEIQTKLTKTGTATNFIAEYPEYDGTRSRFSAVCFNKVAEFVGKQFRTGDSVIVEGSVFLDGDGLIVRAFRVSPAKR
jgi:single-stranded DNA-binding protein